MKKLLSVVVVTLSLTLPATPAFAGNACKTVLCLAGSIMGGKGGSACKSPIQDYFDILRFRKGKFSPSRTLSARQSFLNQCSSAAAENKSLINSMYGTVYSNPGF